MWTMLCVEKTQKEKILICAYGFKGVYVTEWKLDDMDPPPEEVNK